MIPYSCGLSVVHIKSIGEVDDEPYRWCAGVWTHFLQSAHHRRARREVGEARTEEPLGNSFAPLQRENAHTRSVVSMTTPAGYRLSGTVGGSSKVGPLYCILAWLSECSGFG